MPNSLDLTVDDRKLRFLDDLTLQELDANDQPTRQTTWGSVPNETGNDITFRFDGETGTSLNVVYSFNDKNQLTLQIPKQDGVVSASGVWALQGQIAIDDNRDLLYNLIDDDGN